MSATECSAGARAMLSTSRRVTNALLLVIKNSKWARRRGHERGEGRGRKEGAACRDNLLLTSVRDKVQILSSMALSV